MKETLSSKIVKHDVGFFVREETLKVNDVKKFIDKTKTLIIAYHGSDIERLLDNINKLAGKELIK